MELESINMQSGSETYIIIQARMTSTRLANKVLLPLCGKTVLEVIVDRLIGYKDNIIISTSYPFKLSIIT